MMSADGKRFLIDTVISAEVNDAPIAVVLNWAPKI